VKHAQDLLEQIGLEPERVQMFNISSAMAGQFVSTAQEMTLKIMDLGINPLRKPEMQEIDLLEKKKITEVQELIPKSEVSK
jgi:hypothetical protein